MRSEKNDYLTEVRSLLNAPQDPVRIGPQVRLI